MRLRRNRKEKKEETAAELWRFGSKAFETYYNVRDPQDIQQRAENEIPLEKVHGDWPVSTDSSAHLKVIDELFDSGATIVNIHFHGMEVLPYLKRTKTDGS